MNGLAQALHKVIARPLTGTVNRCDYVLAATRIIWAAMGQGIEPAFLQSQNAEQFFSDIHALQKSNDCFAQIDHNSRLGKRWRRVRGQLLKPIAPATRFDPWAPNAHEHEAALIIRASVGPVVRQATDYLCDQLEIWQETPESVATLPGVANLGVYITQPRPVKWAQFTRLDSHWLQVRELIAKL